MQNFKQMKTFKTILTLCFFYIFITCSDKKTETKSIKTTSKSAAKKENNKITRVKLKAFIGNDTLTFNEQINQNTMVSLFRNGIAFKYSDSDKKEVLVSFSGPDFYNNIPRSFDNQLQSMTPEEKVSKDIYKSKLLIYLPGKTADKSIYLYKGTLNLKQFTDNLIEIEFKGTGFPPIDPNIKSNAKYFVPLKGTIIIKDYNIIDSR